MVGVAGRKAGKWENCSVDFPIGEADFPSAKVPYGGSINVTNTHV